MGRQGAVTSQTRFGFGYRGHQRGHCVSWNRVTMQRSYSRIPPMTSWGPFKTQVVHGESILCYKYTLSGESSWSQRWYTGSWQVQLEHCQCQRQSRSAATIRTRLTVACQQTPHECERRTDKVETRSALTSEIRGDQVNLVGLATEHGVERTRPNLGVRRQFVGNLSE